MGNNRKEVEGKGALAAVHVVVRHASLVPRRRYETFTIRYVAPFAPPRFTVYQPRRNVSIRDNRSLSISIPLFDLNESFLNSERSNFF